MTNVARRLVPHGPACGVCFFRHGKEFSTRTVYSLVVKYVLPLRRVIRFPDEPTRWLLPGAGAGGGPAIVRSIWVARCWIART
jgi:hypothetical protein